MSVCLHILWSSGEIKKTNKYKPGSTETCVRAKRSEWFQVMKVSYSKQKEENLGFFLSLRSMKNNWKGAIPWGKGSESGFSTCHTMAPTPVLLPGKSHGQRSLEGCSPWDCWGSDTTERFHFHFSLSCIGEGNGDPLQCSCLENPRVGGAWWAAVYGAPQSRTRLKWLSSSSSSRSFNCHDVQMDNFVLFHRDLWIHLTKCF